MKYRAVISPLYCGMEDDAFTDLVREIVEAASFEAGRTALDVPMATVRSAAAETTPPGVDAADWLYATAALVLVEGLGDEAMQDEAVEILDDACDVPRDLTYDPPAPTFRP